MGLKAPITYWALGLNRGLSSPRTSEWKRMFQAQEPMSVVPMGWRFKEECLLGYDKYVSNTYSNNYDDPPRISSNKYVYHERPRMMRPQKYIGKNCYHHIECTTTTFLAAFMSKRPLNSVVSTTTTHRKTREDVWWDKHSSEGTNEQQM